MGFDRSKYKTTTKQAAELQDQENSQKRPKSGGQFEMHKIEDGVNIFRFFPFHPDGGGRSWREAKCVSFLEVTKQKRDPQTNRLIEGEFEIRKSPVFNARVHGNLSADPVEAYIDIAKRIAIPNFTTDEKKVKSIMSLITGYKGQTGWVSGISPSDSWVAYANKLVNGVWKFGQIDFKETVKKGLTEIALEMSGGETPDIYTDVEEGYAVQIKRVLVDKQVKYIPSLYRKLIDKVNEQLQIVPLTDVELEEFSKLTPLYKMLVNSYKRSDFDMQIEGLERFDKMLAEKGFPIEVFGIDEFLDIVQVVDSQIKDEPVEEKNKEEDLPFEPDKIAGKPVVSKSSAPLVKPEAGATSQGFKITRKAAAPKPEPVVEEQEEDAQDEAPQEAGYTPAPTNAPVMSTADRLAAIKAKHKAK